MLPVTLPLEAMPAVVTLSVGWELTGQQHRDSLLPKGGNAMASSSQGRKRNVLFFLREETPGLLGFSREAMPGAILSSVRN